MSTTFRLNADELGPSFLDKIKAMFAHQHIRISVTREETGSSSPGVFGSDLLRVIDSFPQFSKEESEAFSSDLREVRRMGNQPLPPDRWVS